MSRDLKFVTLLIAINDYFTGLGPLLVREMAFGRI